MGVMTLLVICSIVVSSGFLLAFLWATCRGQYDDTATPSIRMLFEDRHTDESETEHDVRHSSDGTKQ